MLHTPPALAAALIAGASALVAPGDPPHAADPPPGPREFRMGFTGFVPDITLEAVTGARKFVREHGDILAHHIEGVPWAEALAGLPFSKELLEEWEGKRSATPKKGQVYLAISPGRGDLKPAEKALPIPPELRGKAYDDPLVKKAYLAYCRRSMEYFHPDYLAIGIEVNEILGASRASWQAYVTLHRFVYEELRKEHPRLPIFASLTLHNLVKSPRSTFDEMGKLMGHCDVLAVSYYPFFVGGDRRLSAFEWLFDRFDRFKKPYAMVETNDAAERLVFPSSGLAIEGTPQKQLEYFDKLLAVAQERRFLFVIAFVHQDYDRLWEKIKAGAPELFMAWRDCGLLDEEGRARPALELWQRWLARPLREREARL